MLSKPERTLTDWLEGWWNCYSLTLWLRLRSWHYLDTMRLYPLSFGVTVMKYAVHLGTTQFAYGMSRQEQWRLHWWGKHKAELNVVCKRILQLYNSFSLSNISSYVWTTCYSVYHRLARRCLTLFPTRPCVDAWPRGAQIDTSGCGTLAPKVPLSSSISQDGVCISFLSNVLINCPLLFPHKLPRWLIGAAVSYLPHWLGHCCEVGHITRIPVGLWFSGQSGETVGHQKVRDLHKCIFRLYFLSIIKCLNSNFIWVVTISKRSLGQAVSVHVISVFFALKRLHILLSQL